MELWTLLILAYVGVAVLTFLPIAVAVITKVKPLTAGAAKFDATGFSEDNKSQLKEHFIQIAGTLGFWKKQAAIYTRFHYYAVCWTILSGWIVPLLSALGPEETGVRWLITLISAHVALSLSFHRGLNVGQKLKTFRHSESTFYDLYRRIQFQPQTFVQAENDQVNAYFEAIAHMRTSTRNTETETIPDVDQIGGASPNT